MFTNTINKINFLRRQNKNIVSEILDLQKMKNANDQEILRLEKSKKS